MEIILLARILAILEYSFYNRYSIDDDYLTSRYQEILKETQDIFYHLYLEL